MSTNSPTIPRETARHVLFHFDPAHVGSAQPGTFTQNLIRTFATADEVNFRQLSGLYPEYGHAVTLAKYDPQGIAYLQRIATGEGPLGCKCGDSAGPFDLQGRCENCIEVVA